jgi:hypothetical protein
MEDVSYFHIESGEAKDDVIVGHRQSSQFSKHESGNKHSHYYPLITAPLAGKTLDETVSFRAHRNTAVEFLNDCHKFLIVGTSGLDDDLFELLNLGSIPGRTLVHVVDRGKAAVTLNRFTSKVDQLKFRSAHRKPVEFNHGFKEYMNSDQFEEFARATM